MAESNRNGVAAVNRWPRIKDLYYDLIDAWYGDEDHRRARRLADRLHRLIELEDPAQEAILGQDCRAMICEVRGDLDGAIRHRLKEIPFRKRFLQAMPPPGKRSDLQKAALDGYDVDDLADRYDLLAILYHDAGQLKKAIRTLWQSRKLCELHGVRFDGMDLLRDYLAEYRSAAPAAR
jgi:hypothetical protein